MGGAGCGSRGSHGGALLVDGSTNPARAGAFPGKNGRIAFTSHRDGNFEVYSMKPDGSSLTDLTKNPNADGDPSYSAGGKKIAFDSNRAGNDEIYSMNPDGSSTRRLTNNPAQDMFPSWSPWDPSDTPRKPLERMSSAVKRVTSEVSARPSGGRYPNATGCRMPDHPH
jgi:hypothetical protein